MIKSIILQNFQSHKDTLLELDSGVNLICGSSDSGKSAIIRALKWLATNRPLGDGFVSWGSKKETIVEVVLDDGSSIIHGQGNYAIAKENKCQDWSAIGTTIPETVTQALNLSVLSWQSQMDAPFLLSASPGEVARMLNEVADLDKIDSTLVNINRMARDNRAQLTETARAKQQLEIDLSAFRELDNQLAKISQLKEMERKAGLLEELVVDGKRLIISIAKQEETLIQYKDIEKQLYDVQQLQRFQILLTAEENEIGLGQHNLSQVKNLISRLEKIKDPSDAEAELDLLLDMVGQEKKLDKDIDDMTEQIVEVAKKQSYLVHITENLKQLEQQWKTEFPSVCPLCGRGVKQ